MDLDDYDNLARLVKQMNTTELVNILRFRTKRTEVAVRRIIRDELKRRNVTF